MLWSSPSPASHQKRGYVLRSLHTHTNTHDWDTNTCTAVRVGACEAGHRCAQHGENSFHCVTRWGWFEVGGGEGPTPRKKINNKISTKWHYAGLSLKKDTPDEDIWSLRTITWFHFIFPAKNFHIPTHTLLAFCCDTILQESLEFFPFIPFLLSPSCEQNKDTHHKA